jgi:signal transduction histidine kinase
MSGSANQQLGLPRWQRLLLPGGLLEPSPSGRRTARDWIVDVVAFLVAIGVGVVVLLSSASDHSPLALGIDIAIGTIGCLALWDRRSRPVEVAIFTITASAFSALAAGPAVVAIFNAAIRTSWRALAGIAVLALASTAIFPLLYPSNDSYVVELVLGILITAVVMGWGLFVRAQRELVFSLRERAERVEAEHRLKVEQAREAERLRIAREMHDVLAHRVSLLSLHAGALEFRPDASPEDVAEAAAVIRATAHAALEDLRAVVGVLRDGVEDGRPEPPQPTLGQIQALVEESRAAGMEVRAHIAAPAAGTVPEAIGRTAYRVVQEGLTNARKHASAAAVDVTVAADEDNLLVEVVSRPRVSMGARRADPLPGTGTGLVGLAERVALAGGELEHGPDTTGDFVLRATLPSST